MIFAKRSLPNTLFLFCFRLSHLFIPLSSASGVPDGADHPWPSQGVVAQYPRTVGQVVAVGVGPGVRAGHGGDDGGLHHPLQVLAGGDCIDSGDEGTVGARHVDPVLLQNIKVKNGGVRRRSWRGGRTLLITAPSSHPRMFTTLQAYSEVGGRTAARGGPPGADH